MLFIPLLDRAWHVAVVALLVIGVDTYSVFAGPTKQLLEQGDDVISTFTVPLTAPGMYGAAGIGITDFLFLGLFCGAALHWRLRPRLTLPLCGSRSRRRSWSPSCWTAPCPRLPLLSLAFVLPNIGRLRPSAPDVRGSCARFPRRRRTRRATPPRGPTAGSLWVTAQGACWELLDPLIAPGAIVGIVGAGNCDDLPLTRIAERARPRRPARPRPGGLPRRHRARATDRAHEDPGPGGRRQRRPRRPHLGGGRGRSRRRSADGPTGARSATGPYDVVIGDLFYSQLLYPGLRNAGVPDERIMLALANYGPALTGLVVSACTRARPTASSSTSTTRRLVGRHAQPFTLDHVLAVAGPVGRRGAGAAPDRLGPGGHESSFRPGALGIPILRTSFWRWPFGHGTDYLACATVAAVATGLRPRR